MNPGPPVWIDTLMQRSLTEFAPMGSVPTQPARESAVLMLFGAEKAATSAPASAANSNVREDPTKKPLTVSNLAETTIVLTQRAENLRKHPGQVSFPGGTIDGTDHSPAAAALREAQEEIGLHPENVRVLGNLPKVPLTVTNFLVHPVIAWEENWQTLHPHTPAEVARVQRVKIADLVNPQNRHTATHPRGFAGPAFTVDGLYIWGFTAIVLDRTLTLAGLSQEWDQADRRQVPWKHVFPSRPTPQEFLKMAWRSGLAKRRDRQWRNSQT